MGGGGVMAWMGLLRLIGLIHVGVCAKRPGIVEVAASEFWPRCLGIRGLGRGLRMGLSVLE